MFCRNFNLSRWTGSGWVPLYIRSQSLALGRFTMEVSDQTRQHFVGECEKSLMAERCTNQVIEMRLFV